MKITLILLVAIIQLIGLINRPNINIKEKFYLTIDKNIIESKSNEKDNLPKDTLDFLDYNELLEFQNREKLVIPEILKYALSSEIRIIRNEMFARKGYKFKDNFLTEYFSRYGWYNPLVSSINNIKFSIDEKSLLDTLILYEKKNSNLTIDSLRNELKKILLIPEYSKKIPITLWRHIIGEYPTTNNLGLAPWDFLGDAYSVQYCDTTMGFLHCLITFYRGFEGPDCVSQTIYILDKNLNLIHETYLQDEFYSIKKISQGIYSFKTMVEKENENWEEEQGTYKILKTGEIEIRKNR